MVELYANRNKTEPSERQALEMLFMQRVDDLAAPALAYLENQQRKPSDPDLRNGWSRFIMSMIHRSPERVEYLRRKIEDYESGELNKEIEQRYNELRDENHPPTYTEWVATQQPLGPDLLARLLRMLIDSETIGNTLNRMRWGVIEAKHGAFGYLTGDLPLMMSDGLGHERSFIALAISPSRLFVAANDQSIIDHFRSRSHNSLQRALNNVCARQSQHLLIAEDTNQIDFVDRRLRRGLPDSGASGWPSWPIP